MGRQNDRMVASQRSDEISDLDDLLGVESDRRLVEDHDLGISDQSHGDTDSLSVSLREVSDNSVIDVRDTDDLADLLEVLDSVELTALEVIAEGEILLDRHIEIERRLLGQVSDAAFCLERVVKHVDAVDLHASRR